MRPIRLLFAAALLAAGGADAKAAWNNVFQVCCNTCGTPAPAVAMYSDPCAPPPPVCTTRYVQRTYYAPVTTYKQTTYSVPVTTYRTSYYYEACTSYRYSCYFDPCTCRYQQVAQPVVSYRLRSKCCPVTSYLQRTCMTPVTTMQAYTYYEPQTTCCTTTTGAPVAAPPAGAPPSAAPPSTDETRSLDRLPPPPPGSSETRDNPASDTRGYSPSPYAPESTFKPAPPVRHDRMASRGTVSGKVVDGASVPRSAARVLFVSTAEKRDQHVAQASADGQFHAQLTPGGWLVYTYGPDGKPVFSRRIEVPNTDRVQVTLVCR
jgi:hypothetical protein